MRYEFLEHTADIKFRAYGKTLNELFENAVLAVAAYVGKGEKIHPRKARRIEVHGTDIENLLYSFLDELIYLMDAEKFVTAKAEVFVRGNNLTAELYGDAATQYEGLDAIKAATYADMYVKKTSKGWELQVVLDV